MKQLFTYHILIIVLALCFLQLCTTNNAYSQTENYPVAVDTATLEELNMNTEEVSAEDDAEISSLQEKLLDAKKKEAIYQQRNITDTAWKNITSDKDLVYIELKEKKSEPQKKENNPTNFSKFNWNLGKDFGTVMLFILIALVIVIIIYAFFGKQYFSKKDIAIVQEETTWEDVQEFNEWDKAIAEALYNNNYRLATRILYLQSLQKLNDHSWINYKKETLTSAYMQKLYDTRLYASFAVVTRYFDYTWYGHYELTAENFQQIRAQFIQFQNSITA